MISQEMDAAKKWGNQAMMSGVNEAWTVLLGNVGEHGSGFAVAWTEQSPGSAGYPPTANFPSMKAIQRSLASFSESLRSGKQIGH
jgi:hypothetical protein